MWLKHAHSVTRFHVGQIFTIACSFSRSGNGGNFLIFYFEIESYNLTATPNIFNMLD